MAKGEQHPFGHDLLGQCRFATEAVDNPRLSGTELLVEAQELVEGSHAVNHHGLPYPFGYFGLSQESRRLQLEVAAPQCVESTLAYGPDVGQLGIGVNLCHPVWPTGIYIPRMQPDGTGLHLGTDFAGIAVEHESLGGVGGNGMGVEIEHSGLPMELFGHGVVTATAPGMAPQDALDGQV